MKKPAKTIMIQGTSSHVGKSVLTAALCRILKNRGFSVAPFKAQNMALNSSVTADGGEIGRAQFFQAEAAGAVPTVDMNPILLKPSADSVTQVIIHGRVRGNMSAVEYHGFKKEARRFVFESFRRLERSYDAVVIEGAGSPAEINLRENDLANMGVAEMADSPVMLVGDIDRGGVFASIVGTMELLTEGERARIKGFIINKFRGDIALLKPGLDFLEERTGVPVLGVVPHMGKTFLPSEDGVSLDEGAGAGFAGGGVRIAVVRLPRISNFTDFDPFSADPGVELAYIDGPEGLRDAHVAVIPGSKNTLGDLEWLKKKGFDNALRRFRDLGGFVWGVCGGFQMLGRLVKDPYSVESDAVEVEGLGLLDVETVMMKVKATYQVEAETIGPADGRHAITGYEIHMGLSSGKAAPFALISSRNGAGVSISDGGVSGDGKVRGTYIHGVFDNDGFRDSFVEEVRKARGIEGRQGRIRAGFRDRREEAIGRLAGVVEKSVDIGKILDIMGF